MRETQIGDTYIKLKRNLKTTTRTIISTTTTIADQSHPAKPPLLLRKNLICPIHPLGAH
jgi:hypothetical protein